MATKKQTPVSVGFAVNKQSADLMANKGANALDDGGQIVVKTAAGRTLAPGGGGYETRLWEKITCDILGGRLDPGDIVSRPDILGITVTPVAEIKMKKAVKRAAKKKK